MINRTWVKQGHHQVELVAIAAVIQRRAVLPTIPYATQCIDIFPHPRSRRMVFQSEATSNMASDLRTQSQYKTPLRQFLQGPCGHCCDSGATRKSQGDRGRKAQCVGRLRGERYDNIGILFCLLYH